MNQLSMFSSKPKAKNQHVHRALLETAIQQGEDRARKTIAHVESVQPVDRVVKAVDFEFDPMWGEGSEPVKLLFPSEVASIKAIEGLHLHALQQICDKSGLPWVYAKRLIKIDRELNETTGWGRELLCYNLAQLFKRNKKRYLLRSVDEQVRGFLSDKFRRLDSRRLVGAFIGAAGIVNADLFDGWYTDLNVSLEMVVPHIYEPIAKEAIVYGTRFKNSDFGEGAQEVLFVMVRLPYFQTIIGPAKLRKVHLGKRLKDDIKESKPDYEEDQKNASSEIVTKVTDTLSEHNIETMQKLIRLANETVLSGTKLSVTIELMRRLLSKKEVDDVVKTFEEVQDESLPSGATVWRLASIISKISKEQEDNDKKHELQVLAGKLLMITH
jgi:hypothetical protein